MQETEVVLSVLRERGRTWSRTRHKSLESPVPGKRARRVRREAARKRTAISGTSPGSPPYWGSRPTRESGKAARRAKLRRLTRRWIAPAGSRGSGGGDLWATRLT